MTLTEAIPARHSVRSYQDIPLSVEDAERLRAEAAVCSASGGLHIQLIQEEPNALGGYLARRAGFVNARNYLALVGTKTRDLDERAGWFGERLVLFAQTLGLSTCWVGGSYSARAVHKSASIEKGEKLVAIIAVGYGAERGEAHESRPLREVFRSDRTLPEWFGKGLKAALLAPTALNQQRFRFTLLPDGSVEAKSLGGPCSHIDLGIVSYHFLLGAGEESFRWAK